MSHELASEIESSTFKSETPSVRFGWYQRIPLFARIIIALMLGVLVGEMMGSHTAVFKPFSAVVLRLLGALATPLIFMAVVRALLKAKISGRAGLRLVSLLLFNTVVAIVIGLAVANVVQPGVRADIAVKRATFSQKPFDPVEDLLGKIPGSVVKPFADNDIMAVILIALAIGIGLRKVRQQQESGSAQESESAQERSALPVIEALLDTGFRLVMVILHWILELVPLAVFGVVAQKVGMEGIGAFKPMLWFILAVLLALGLQTLYYLARVHFGSWVRPGQFLKGGSEALLLAFSTASSAATLPITYHCMRDKIGVREDSVSLGVMVGGAFNHDGTALYEAMAALFISQVIGRHLGLGEQLIVVFMAVTASVGAAGIPEAGLVTMLAVFTAVRLPIEMITMLLTVDWFLDRCRTAINVMGDMSVTCILDGKIAAAPSMAEVHEFPVGVETA